MRQNRRDVITKVSRVPALFLSSTLLPLCIGVSTLSFSQDNSEGLKLELRQQQNNGTDKSSSFSYSSTQLTAGVINRDEVPPPLGPPLAQPEAKRFFLTIFLRDALQQAGQQIIDLSNAKLEEVQDLRARLRWAANAKPLECGYECMSPPRMSTTRHRDQPNEKVVSVSASLSFVLDKIQKKIAGVWVPVPSRTIRVNVKFRANCSGWLGGNGHIQIFTKVDQPVIDQEHSVIEDILDFVAMPFNLSRFIDAQVAKHLPRSTSPPPQEPQNSSCESLGLISNYPNEDMWRQDAIVWDPGRRLSLPTNISGESAKVAFTRIKRLKVRPEELSSSGDIVFSFYVNGHPLTYPTAGGLQLAENASVDLNEASVIIPISNEVQTLQLIVSDDVGGAGWTSFDRRHRFGSGTHTIRTHRTVLQSAPDVPGFPDHSRRPQKLDVQEFEVTFQIEFRRSVIRN